jgi:nucleotide-binding universal stress UspA family protein
MTIDRILFPTDFTEGSAAAIPYAAELVRKFSARLYIIHVIVDIGRATGWYVPHASTGELAKQMEKSAKDQLDRAMLEEMRGYPDIERALLVGSPAEEILRYAEKNNIGLIVMGTHGRKGLDKILFGSTAEKVVRSADCPVLTVRAK